MQITTSKVMCWIFKACSHHEVLRLLEHHGALIGFLAVVIASGVVGVAFACRRRSAVESEIERILEDARKRINDTNFG